MLPSVGATSRQLYETEDPFRKGLSEAIQWLDALRIHDEEDLEQVISTAASHVKDSLIPVDADVALAQALPLEGHQLHVNRTSCGEAGAPSGSICLMSPMETEPPPTHPQSAVRDETTQRIMNDGADVPLSSRARVAGEEGLNPSSPLASLEQHAMRETHTLRVAELIDDGHERSTGTSENTPKCSLQSGECDRYLQQLCPACFGGTEFGCPIARYLHAFGPSLITDIV
jgi:hypothetical protein